MQPRLCGSRGRVEPGCPPAVSLPSRRRPSANTAQLVMVGRWGGTLCSTGALERVMQLTSDAERPHQSARALPLLSWFSAPHSVIL